MTSGLSTTLLPLVIGSALVPVQIIITILLLRSRSGKRTAVAWLAGMTTMRLLQGLVFGLLLSSADAADDEQGSSTIASVLLLVVAVLFLVSAVRQVVRGDDPDDAPPRWLTMTESVTPGKAFLLGIGVMTIGAKFWVFTLSAISTIGDADLGRPASTVTYLVFVLLAQSIVIAVVLVSVLVPARADALLDRASAWLTANNRVIMIVIGFGFGSWFLVKALDGLSVL